MCLVVLTMRPVRTVAAIVFMLFGMGATALIIGLVVLKLMLLISPLVVLL